MASSQSTCDLPTPIPSSGFEFNAKKVFLTYPQCTLSKEDLVAHFTNGGFPKEPTKWIVCQEAHQDGGHHLHAIVEFSQSLHTRDARVFGVQGFHPNLGGVRRLRSAYEYVKKDGDFIESEDVLVAPKRSYTEAFAKPSKAEMLEYIRENFP